MPERIPAKVARVVDGDTVRVNPARVPTGVKTGTDGSISVRLVSIDCPELHTSHKGVDAPQPGAEDCLNQLTKILANVKGDVVLELVDIDQYGRAVASIDTGEGLPAELQMVALGYAWVSHKGDHLKLGG